jgi:trimeric autotransporter adhesin
MAQTIQIKRGTGSAIPANLADGELAINLDSGQLYYGSGSTSISHFRFKDITAETYTVSSSVTNLITQTSSGSTTFGDSGGDKHSFIGTMAITGSVIVDENNFISSSGDIISSQTIVMQTASIGGGIFTSASLAVAIAGNVDLSAHALITNVVSNSATSSFVTNAQTSSFLTSADTLVSSSAQIASDISGSVSATSHSLQSRVTIVENATVTLPANLVSSSLQLSGDISGAFNGITSSFIKSGTDVTFNNIRSLGNVIAENYIISSSVTHISSLALSGSSEFGNTSDDTHQFIGNITSSGNISASGAIIASNISGTNTGDQNISNLALTSSISGAFTEVSNSLQGRIGTLETHDHSTFALKSAISGAFNGQTSSFALTSNVVANSATSSFLSSIPIGTYSSSLQILGNITSSGNISSSGTIIASNISGTNTGDEDLTNYIQNSQTSSFLVPSDTGSFALTNAVVANSATGSFVVNSQTGSFLTSVPIDTSGLKSLKINASLQTGSLTVGPVARQIELRGGSTFTSTNPRILSATGIIEVDDAIQMNSHPIYFHEGATNSYIGVDVFTPDNLEIHANQDLELIPDDNLVISSSTGAKTIHHNELQVIGDVNASGNILFNNISGGTF